MSYWTDTYMRHEQMIDRRQQAARQNLIAQVNITYPKKLNKEQKELLEQLEESFGAKESKPHENVLDSAIDKMKGWFK